MAPSNSAIGTGSRIRSASRRSRRQGTGHRRGDRHLRAGFLDERPADAEPGGAVRLHQGFDPGPDAAGQPVRAGAAVHAGRLQYIPIFRDVSPRFGAAYDLFGNGKTAVKGAVGPVHADVGDESGGLLQPHGRRGETAGPGPIRNGDDIAQESELGPWSNRELRPPAGVATPNPDMQRPYQMLYNASVQQELIRGLSVTLGYYHRRYYDDTVDGQPRDHARGLHDHSDPRPARQRPRRRRLQRRPAKFGLVDKFVTNSSENRRTYHGIDLSFLARLPTARSCRAASTRQGRMTSTARWTTRTTCSTAIGTIRSGRPSR